MGGGSPRKEPILLPLRDSAKTSSPPNPPLCWQSKNTGEAAPAWSQRDCGGRVRDRERERHDQSRPGETPLDRASLATTRQRLLAEHEELLEQQLALLEELLEQQLTLHEELLEQQLTLREELLAQQLELQLQQLERQLELLKAEHGELLLSGLV